MNIPDAAVEAAGEALAEMWAIGGTWDTLARGAITAAMPALREVIAQELDEAWLAGKIHSGLDAARIVRGGDA